MKARRATRLAPSCFWSAALIVAGCGHRKADQTMLDQLNRTVQALRDENAAYARQVEELENRVFILTDRLDSSKVNAEKAAEPQLPTVSLHPGDPLPQDAAEPEAPSTLPQPEVEYAGEAAKSSARRPLLQLYGDEGAVFLRRAEPEPQPIVVAGESAARAQEDASALYRRSLAELRGGRHEEAARGFEAFLRRFAAHDLSDNAQYWLGECRYDRREFPAALREFRRVVELYPQGNKVPDALLKAGYSYLALGSLEAGRQTLAQLVRSYPKHEAAQLAAAKLVEVAAGASGATAPPPATAQPSSQTEQLP